MESAIEEVKTGTNEICSAAGISSNTVLYLYIMTISQRIEHTKIGTVIPTVLTYIEERQFFSLLLTGRNGIWIKKNSSAIIYTIMCICLAITDLTLYTILYCIVIFLCHAIKV